MIFSDAAMITGADDRIEMKHRKALSIMELRVRDFGAFAQ